MAVELATAYVSLVPTATGISGAISKELNSPLEKAGDEAGTKSAAKFGGSFAEGMKTAAKAAAVALGAAAVGSFVKSSINAASDVNESMSKVKVVFGDASTAVLNWSKTSATAMGQSQGQALEAVGTYGNLLKAFGLTSDQAQGMSTSMVELAADLASFNNTSVDEALQAIQSGLSGEQEPLRKFGVSLSDARLKTEAMSLGLIKSTSEALTPAAKAQASYSLIMKDTTLAQGDFAKTSDGLANKQRILSAEFQNAQAKIGAVLLPALAAVAGFVSDHFVPVLIGVTAVLGTVFTVWVAGAIAANAATIALVAPYIAVAAAIAVLAAGVIYAYTHFGWFKTAVDAVRNFIVNDLVPAFQAIWSFIKDRIIPVISTLVEAYIKGLITEFNAVRWVIVNVVIPALQAIWAFITNYVIPIFQTIIPVIAGVVSAVGGHLNTMVGFVVAIPGRIGGVISTLWDGLRDGITFAKDWVRWAIDTIVGFVAGLPGRVAGIFVGMFDGIKEAFRSAINWIIRAWNGLRFSLPKIDLGPLGSIGGWTVGTPQIPQLHQGGVVPGAGDVPALLRGGELVLTGAQQAQLFNLANGAGAGGQPITVNNYGRDFTVNDMNHVLAMARLRS